MVAIHPAEWIAALYQTLKLDYSLRPKSLYLPCIWYNLYFHLIELGALLHLKHCLRGQGANLQAAGEKRKAEPFKNYWFYGTNIKIYCLFHGCILDNMSRERFRQKNVTRKNDYTKLSKIVTSQINWLVRAIMLFPGYFARYFRL